MIIDVFYGIVKSSKTLRCLLCCVYIPKAKKCVEQHIAGRKHKSNIEIMTRSAIEKDNDQLYCRLCQLHLNDNENESVVNHVEDPIHHQFDWDALNRFDEEEFIRSELYLACRSDYAICEVCNTKIEFSIPNMYEHTAQVDHKIKLLEAVKRKYGLVNTDKDYELHCTRCNGYAPNSLRDIWEHLEDESHWGCDDY